MNIVTVQLPNRAYDIRIGSGILPEAGQRIAALGASKAFILTSPTLDSLYGQTLRESLDAAKIPHASHIFPDGEDAKQWAQLGSALSAMALAGIDRRACVVALGGGAIGDAAGCAAGLFMRGIKLVQIPTTLLSMVDSSIGGKTGVNLPEGKNLVGVFQQPSLVLADMATLASLPDREIRAGAAEIIKHGIIRDAALFEELEKGRPADWTEAIVRSCSIKARVIEADEFEILDIRALLNFGHTVGHAIEAAAGYGSLLHGEAVSIGLAAAAWMSVQKAGMPQAEAARIVAMLTRYGLPVHAPDLNSARILELLFRDKKFAAGKIRFVLSRRIGTAFVSESVTRADIEAAVAHAIAPSAPWQELLRP